MRGVRQPGIDAINRMLGVEMPARLGAALASTLVAASVVTAAPLLSPGSTARADGRIAIIDAAFDTRPFLDRLKTNGVTAIGRYLGRCPQWAGKRIIENGRRSEPDSEISKILTAGFSVFSIYQYLSSSTNKFRGRGKDGSILRDKDCMQTKTPNTVVQEATYDARAAATQAQEIGQPPGSAIFFGMDFNFAGNDLVTRSNLIKYFTVIKRILSEKGYLVGVYGNGLANEILLDKGLASFAWISASPSFAGTSRFHNSGRWHLFQNVVDFEWFSSKRDNKCDGLRLDTNVQNKRHADNYVGFWNRNGLARVEQERTEAVYDARRFICDGNAVVRRAANAPSAAPLKRDVCYKGAIARSNPIVEFARSVRVGPVNGHSLVPIDVDDDGKFDGWTGKENITPGYARKPIWIDGRKHRHAAKCE